MARISSFGMLLIILLETTFQVKDCELIDIKAKFNSQLGVTIQRQVQKCAMMRIRSSTERYV